MSSISVSARPTLWRRSGSEVEVSDAAAGSNHNRHTSTQQCPNGAISKGVGLTLQIKLNTWNLQLSGGFSWEKILEKVICSKVAFMSNLVTLTAENEALPPTC